MLLLTAMHSLSVTAEWPCNWPPKMSCCRYSGNILGVAYHCPNVLRFSVLSDEGLILHLSAVYRVGVGGLTSVKRTRLFSNWHVLFFIPPPFGTGQELLTFSLSLLPWMAERSSAWWREHWEVNFGKVPPSVPAWGKRDYCSRGWGDGGDGMRLSGNWDIPAVTTRIRRGCCETWFSNTRVLLGVIWKRLDRPDAEETAEDMLPRHLAHVHSN